MSSWRPTTRRPRLKATSPVRRAVDSPLPDGLVIPRLGVGSNRDPRELSLALRRASTAFADDEFVVLGMGFGEHLGGAGHDPVSRGRGRRRSSSRRPSSRDEPAPYVRVARTAGWNTAARDRERVATASSRTNRVSRDSSPSITRPRSTRRIIARCPRALCCALRPACPARFPVRISNDTALRANYHIGVLVPVRANLRATLVAHRNSRCLAWPYLLLERTVRFVAQFGKLWRSM